MGTGAMDLVMVVDVESKYQEAYLRGRRFNPRPLAQALGTVARAYGPQRRCIAIVSRYDTASQDELARWGFEIIGVNGDRRQTVGKLQQEIYALVLNDPPGKLILVTIDPSFNRLGITAARKTQVAIWGSDDCVSEPISPVIDTRPLVEIIPDHPDHTIDIRIDYENLHWGLVKMERPFAPQVIIGAVRKIAEKHGRVRSITAYGDWKNVYIPHMDINIQRELEEMNVHTRYQINRNGKNAADMEISNDLRTLFDSSQGEGIDEEILCTMDRDFKPVIETLREQGVIVTLVGLTGGVSSFLKAVVDEILYLDQEIPGAEHGNKAPVGAGYSLNSPVTHSTMIS